MNEIGRVLTVLAVTASIVMSQEVKAVVHDLRSPKGAAWQKACQLLREMPAEAVTTEIRRALKEDAEFSLGSGRLGVSEFLSDLAKERRLRGQAIERPYLELLKEGLADSNRAFRKTAVDALALAEPGVQKEVAGWITPLLEDSALEVVEAVARALGRFERRAEDSAPVLLKLLNDPDEETRKRWEENQAIRIGPSRPEDRDLVARMGAAVARLAILPAWTDFDLYPRLDEKGQLAGAMAIVLSGEKLPSRLAADPARARQAIALVAPLLGNALVNRDMQLAPLMIWALIIGRLDGEAMKEVRGEALARIEDASKHKDERVSKAAAQMLEVLNKHK